MCLTDVTLTVGIYIIEILLNIFLIKIHQSLIYNCINLKVYFETFYNQLS